jgi:hypothetical protein
MAEFARWDNLQNGKMEKWLYLPFGGIRMLAKWRNTRDGVFHRQIQKSSFRKLAIRESFFWHDGEFARRRSSRDSVICEIAEFAR